MDDIDSFRSDPLNRLAADIVRHIQDAGVSVPDGIDALNRAYAMTLASAGHGGDGDSLDQRLRRMTVPQIVRFAREYRAMGMGKDAVSLTTVQ